MYFSIPNNRATSVTEVEHPETLPPPDYTQFGGDKKAFRRWCQNLGTAHHFLSCCEGVSAGLRVSDNNDNPIFKVHGILVDYDGKPPPDTLKYLNENRASEFQPTWLVHTFSGHCRLVWEFEKPFYPVGSKHFKAFMQQVAKAMILNAWLPGFEAGSLGDPAHYYEQGAWEAISTSKVPVAHTELWAIEAAKSVVVKDGLGAVQYKIPIERVGEEVEARFPGKWTKDFVEGVRGPAFWADDSATSGSSVVFAEGMYCFSETVGAGFYPWERIFGKAFVEQFEADKVQEILKEPLHYDGKAFWRQSDEGVWDCLGREDFAQELRLKGFSGRIGKGETSSEIDRIETAVKTTKRVSAVMPFLFYPEGKIWYEGDRYLNVSRAKPMQPAPPAAAPMDSLPDGKQHFPFLYRLLTTMFYDDTTTRKDPHLQDTGVLQLERFLAWLKYFYVNSLEQHPKPGHAIVLAGLPDKGKTFLFKTVISTLMGGQMTGSSDGSGHLVGGEQWTDRLLRTPLILIDDNLMSADPRDVTKFTARVKKYVSSPTMIYNQKYRIQAEVPWFGRIVVLCNLDAESLRVLPNMSISVRDKISLFKASASRMQFGSWEKNQKMMRQELPALARFLVDWEIPERSTSTNPRFGVEVYHHPELLDESLQSGLDGIVLELLLNMQEELRKREDPKGGEWSGTYTALHNQLSVLNERIMHDIRPRALAVCLGNLSRNSYDISSTRSRDGIRVWQVGKDLFRVLRKAEKTNESEEGEE